MSGASESEVDGCPRRLSPLQETLSATEVKTCELEKRYRYRGRRLSGDGSGWSRLVEGGLARTPIKLLARLAGKSMDVLVGSPFGLPLDFLVIRLEIGACPSECQLTGQFIQKSMPVQCVCVLRLAGTSMDVLVGSFVQCVVCQ